MAFVDFFLFDFVNETALKGPKLEIFSSRAFTQTRRVCTIGVLGTRPKIQNFDGLGLKIAISYFLVLSPILLNKFKCCRA